jgi:micrococcal nuclease
MNLRKIGVKTTLILMFCLGLSVSANGQNPVPWSGKVVSVADGDTITVMKENRGVKVRLAEIDCPETGQPYGKAAKKYTSSLCFNKVVSVNPTAIDDYGRTVAHVVLTNERSLNEDLLSAGMAWHYKKYSTSQKLARLEAEARKSKLGLWSEPSPVPPWVWRRQR